MKEGNYFVDIHIVNTNFYFDKSSGKRAKNLFSGIKTLFDIAEVL